MGVLYVNIYRGFAVFASFQILDGVVPTQGTEDSFVRADVYDMYIAGIYVHTLHRQGDIRLTTMFDGTSSAIDQHPSFGAGNVCVKKSSRTPFPM